MSRTYQSGTASSNQRMSYSTNNSSQIQPNSQQPQQQERVPEYRGGYSVIPPNEAKRNKIQQLAAKEAEAHEQYKRNNVPKYNIVRTVGGGPIPRVPAALAPSRSRVVQQTPTAASLEQARRQNREAYRLSQKSLEEQEFTKKKETARLHSEQNAERASARHRRLEEDRTLKNDAFLSRLEAKNKQKHT